MKYEGFLQICKALDNWINSQRMEKKLHGLNLDRLGCSHRALRLNLELGQGGALDKEAHAAGQLVNGAGERSA